MFLANVTAFVIRVSENLRCIHDSTNTFDILGISAFGIASHQFII
jgi:hypothetical protein